MAHRTTVKAETLSVSSRPSERLQVSLLESFSFVYYPPRDVEALTVLVETRGLLFAVTMMYSLSVFFLCRLSEENSLKDLFNGAK